MDAAAPSILAAILQSTRNPILVLSRRAGVIELNDHAARWMGAGREAAIGKDLWNLPPWNAASGVKDSINGAIEDAAEGKAGRIGMPGVDCSVRAALSGDLFVLEMCDQRQAAGIAPSRDVVSRLRESEGRFRAVCEHAGIGIASFNANGVAVESNAALERILGYEADELRRMHFTQFTHRDDKALALALHQDLFSAARTRYEIEKRYIRKDRGTIWVRVVASLVCDPNGAPQFAISLIEDITQKKRREDEILSLSQRLIRAEEEERRRIARELHDHLAQQVAAASIGVCKLRRQLTESNFIGGEELDQLQERLGAIAGGVRRISHELHPAALQLAGIGPSLEALCAEFSAVGPMRVSFEAGDGLDGIPPEAALCLYRITQEALRNADSHSRAKEACVELERSEECVHLTIADKGAGFDPDARRGRAGLGLISMRERARLVQGSLVIESAPGKGTTLRVSIPLPRANASACGTTDACEITDACGATDAERVPGSTT